MLKEIKFTIIVVFTRYIKYLVFNSRIALQVNWVDVWNIVCFVGYNKLCG